MKRVVEFFINLIGDRLAHRDVYHNDALRANQFTDPAESFSFWRSLVG